MVFLCSPCFLPGLKSTSLLDQPILEDLGDCWPLGCEDTFYRMGLTAYRSLRLGMMGMMFSAT